MFSVRQKRDIADAIQTILRATNHPELPENEIQFELRVLGKEPWSWANIRNNSAVPVPDVNPHNEDMDPENHAKRLNLAMLRTGMPVRYRTATRDDPSGIRPDWSDWKDGELYVVRDKANRIICLTIDNAEIAEYSEGDYHAAYNEWLVEDYRLEFELRAK